MATDVISLTKAFDNIHMILLWWHMTSYNAGKAGAYSKLGQSHVDVGFLVVLNSPFR